VMSIIIISYSTRIANGGFSPLQLLQWIGYPV
ncbi:MAG: hypothetical protein ACI90V_003184, partial [Bacillariaceae sp.]